MLTQLTYVQPSPPTSSFNPFSPDIMYHLSSEPTEISPIPLPSMIPPPSMPAPVTTVSMWEVAPCSGPVDALTLPVRTKRQRPTAGSSTSTSGSGDEDRSPRPSKRPRRIALPRASTSSAPSTSSRKTNPGPSKAGNRKLKGPPHATRSIGSLIPSSPQTSRYARSEEGKTTDSRAQAPQSPSQQSRSKAVTPDNDAPPASMLIQRDYSHLQVSPRRSLRIVGQRQARALSQAVPSTAALSVREEDGSEVGDSYDGADNDANYAGSTKKQMRMKPALRATRKRDALRVTGPGSDGLYRCRACTYVSPRRSDVSRHFEDIHVAVGSKKRFPCLQCGNTYTRKESVNRHMRTKHC